MVQQYVSATATVVNGTNAYELFCEQHHHKCNSAIATAAALQTAMKSLNSMVTHTMSNSLATLCNIGNSCYMNSVLYTLRFAPNFTHNLHHLVEFLELTLHKANAEKRCLPEHDEQGHGQDEQSAINTKQKGSLLGAGSDGPDALGGHSWNGKELGLHEKHVNGYETHAAPYGRSSSASDGSAMVSEICFSESEKCSAPANHARGCNAYGGASTPAYTGDSYNRSRKCEPSVSNGNGAKTNRQLVCETLHELYHSLARNEAADTIEPFHAGGLLQAVQRVSSTFEGNQQQDAHEFLMCILDSVRESCLKLNKTLIENPDFLKISSLPSLEKPAPAKGTFDSADSVTASTETKSSTQFIGRNIFRRRKESLRNAKSFAAKESKANAAVELPLASSVKPMAPVSKCADAGAGKDKASLPHETTTGGHGATAAEERLEERIRTLGLNFFCEDFEGVTVSRTRCLSCETVTEQKEIMIDIAIPIASSEISEALKNPQQFYQDACITQEYFRGDNKYRCEVCSGYTEACRTISFDILPRLLVLQLKRFNGDMEKINSYIPTPFVLQCFCADCLGKSDSEKRHVYRLYSVITHVGARMSVGHYIAYTSSLQIPLHYVNCVKDRQRRALLAASSLEAQAAGVPNGIKGVGISGKGHGGGVDKSASGQLKKLFGSKKASSAGDISKKLKNNVINRFSPINGIENLQLNAHATTVCIEKAVRAGYSDNFYSIQSMDGVSSARSAVDCSLGGGSNPCDGKTNHPLRSICDKASNLHDLHCQSVGCCAVLAKNILADDIRHAGCAHAGSGTADEGGGLIGDGLRSSSGPGSAPHHLSPIVAGSMCEMNCAQSRYKLDGANGESQSTIGNCHSSLLSSSSINNQGNSELSYGNFMDDTVARQQQQQQQQLTWYMCDDDKVKIMTQLEFEEILSPNRRHVTTPYLLFYARYDIERKEHNQPKEQSASPTQQHQQQQYQHKMHKVITKHVPAATKSATISV
ncbi:AGAP000884-PB [Anopheles gambiae str. PEST]|uniref:AGAP000884-PA n=1 Tax=Anopheles gambiae TaxID=7165 RepID=Q7Q4T1_ANOGA|nr:AGAP000884-PA [Anopheles gambiae str. PEST]EGK97308.1 AGAP000884-PB [Anopheles gambiae str. PEST]